VNVPHIVIAGGGVIGLSIAWRAAQQGFTVTVADPAPGSGASHAAAGMLTPVAEAAYAEEHLLRLGLASLNRYPTFIEELTELTGQPSGFRRTGTLQVAYDHDDRAVIEETRQLQEKFGVAAERLTARECRELEPMLAPEINGGLFTAGDGSVDPRLLVSALLTAVAKAGVTLTRQLVTTVRPHEATLADGTTLTADWIVIAAGHASARLADIPVRPVKGQILRLRGEPLLTRCVRGIVRGARVYLVPRTPFPTTGGGELVVGATQEDMGADTRVTAGGVWELLRDARALLPGITELEFAEAVAGLRPGTPDNAPVLGPSGLDGVLLATGHFRAGVLLAPITADLITNFMTSNTKRVVETLQPFTLDRFA
jgi:glycine oxidase